MHGENATGQPYKISAVLVLWLITFFGYTVQYMLLTNFNIAMTVMNEGPRSNNSSQSFNSSYSGNWTSDEDYVKQRKKFLWNQSEEALLLSGVYWLLWLSHPIGGTLSYNFGAKIVIGASIFLASCLSLAVPSASFIHMKLLLLVRVIQGFIVGLAFPAIMSVTRYWISENKKGKFLTCFLGMSLGSALTYFTSGFIINAFSWEGIFYVTGTAGILWCAAWWYLMFDKPELHPRMTEKEKQAIRMKTKINFSVENLAHQRHVPWKKILTSGRVYIIAFAQFGLLWIFFTMIIYGPKYVKFYHNLNSVQTGIVSGMPHFTRIIFSIIYAAFTDKIVSKKIVSKTTARKMGTVLSHIIPGLALIMLAFNGQSFPVALISINLCVIMTGAVISGSVAAMTDMSPNYAGIILGLCGTLTHTTGLLSPLLVGYLTLTTDIAEQWMLIFLISAGIAISSGLLFVIFWSSDVQEWDRPYSKVPDEIFINMKTTVNDKIKINDL